MGAEDLVVMRRRHDVGTRMVRSVSYPKGGVLNKTVRPTGSDHDDDEEGMDCGRDDPRRSMYRFGSISFTNSLRNINSILTYVQ